MLLILNQYYGPAESTGRLLQELAEDLGERIPVVVVAADPGDPALKPAPHPGVDVRWAPVTSFGKGSLVGRLADYLSFAVSSLPTLLFRAPRPGVVLCMTNPPFVGLAGALTASVRRAKLAITVQDVHPDVGVVSGRLTSRPAVFALRAVQRFFFRRADRLVAISPGMKERLVALGAPAAKVEVVPNWVDVEEISPHPRDNAWAREHGLAGRFVVMHAGNVGLLQDIETFVEAAKLAPEVTCVIVGEGAGRAALERRAAKIGAANVRFIDRQPRAALNLVLASADAHLVSLMPGLGGLMEPSKLYGILAAGRPVLAAIEPNSEPARVVGEIGCGVAAPPASPEALAAAMDRLRQMPAEEIERMGEIGRGYAELSCVRARSTEAYAAMLGALGA